MKSSRRAEQYQGWGMRLQMGFLVGILVFSFGICSAARSQTTLSDASSNGSEHQNTSKLIKAVGQKKFDEDTRINDLQLRAEAGSLSRYSGSFSFSYAGPSVTDMTDTNIPNPDGRNGDFRTNLGGTV